MAKGKSRFTESDLIAMGLEEDGSGGYRPKRKDKEPLELKPIPGHPEHFELKGVQKVKHPTMFDASMKVLDKNPLFSNPGPDIMEQQAGSGFMHLDNTVTVTVERPTLEQAPLFSPFKITEPQANKVVNGKTYIGADPGSTGAFSVMVNGEIVESIPFPQLKIKSKKASKTREGEYKLDKLGKRIYAMVDRLDEDGLAAIVKQLHEQYPDAVVILEKVKNIMGSGAMQNFNFGYNFGYLSGLLVAAGFEIHLATPQAWQKQVIQLRDKVKKPDDSNDTKATSGNALTRIFPNLDLRATKRSTKFHDGMVDSALLAYYGHKLNL